MRKENFAKLRVGDKIKFEWHQPDFIRTGIITRIDKDVVITEPCWYVTRRQIICKIVNRKRVELPKVTFVGYWSNGDDLSESRRRSDIDAVFSLHLKVFDKLTAEQKKWLGVK